MNYPLSDEKRWSIIALLKTNSFSKRQIARRLNCHYNTVHNIATLYNTSKTISPRLHPGRPKKLNKGDELSFRLALRKNPTATVQELKTFL